MKTFRLTDVAPPGIEVCSVAGVQYVKVPSEREDAQGNDFSIDEAIRMGWVEEITPEHFQDEWSYYIVVNSEMLPLTGSTQAFTSTGPSYVSGGFKKGDKTVFGFGSVPGDLLTYDAALLEEMIQKLNGNWQL